MKPPPSGGILLYRRGAAGLEVLLAHPGGPYWQRQDRGAWSIPKGIADGEEDLAAVAVREFAEETSFEVAAVARDPARRPLALGSATLKSGKVVHAWAVEGDLDPALARSNEFELEWPPRSGRTIVIPEVDRVEWFDVAEARHRIHPGQAPLLDRLVEQLTAGA
ncbi:MAG TPA: NUDIX domain-containing protein [Candidatus Deferrimicrobiaceae bacterium]|nr:NUDIX domain-containing protein [Candidatus Deferrimicrobiaceae bacterium]